MAEEGETRKLRRRKEKAAKEGKESGGICFLPQVWDQAFGEELHVLGGNGRCPRNTSTNESERERARAKARARTREQGRGRKQKRNTQPGRLANRDPPRALSRRK